MPRLKNKVPSYCRHKATGQAVVTLNGKDHYLGPHSSAESREQYDRLIKEWLASNRRPHLDSRGGADQAADNLTVTELCVAFLAHAKSYYRKSDGTPTNEVTTLKQAIKPLRRLYGDVSVEDFGPLSLKTVRNEMIEAGWCRRYINRQVGRIKSIFGWGVENELVPAVIHQALLAVRGLAKGRSAARESKKVRPVDMGFVEAIQLHVSKQVWAMVRLQALTGMRSGEVITMRGCDLDTSGEIWIYSPECHKTEHHDHEKHVCLGPQAQEVLRPFLKPELSAYVFSPLDAETDRLERMHQRRKTPLHQGNKPGSNRKRKRRVGPGEYYTASSYRRAIDRACDVAFPPPGDLARKKVRGAKGPRWETYNEWKERLGPERWSELKEWKKAHHWHPHQLRHTKATAIRKKYGLDAARAVLGHRSVVVTDNYAELDMSKAAEVMRAIG